MKPERLAELIDAHLDGAISGEGVKELSAVLVKDAEARREYWAKASVHGTLPEAVHLAWLSGATPQSDQKIVALPIDTKWSRLSAIARNVGLAAAACFMIAGTWWSSQQDWWPWADRSVATLVRAPGAIWENRGEINRDSRLLAGRYRLQAGAAEIRFRSGARLVVEAPSEIELTSINGARLFSGQASGFVPPEARGFTVVTPALTLVDLGTAFGLKMPPSGPAEAHVFEGQVSVYGDTGADRSLFRGEAVRVTDGAFVDIASRPQDFVTAEGLAARESAIAKRHLAKWRKLADKTSRDPSTLVHFTCENQDRYDTVLRNEALSQNADAYTAMIFGATRSEGRWPGKAAIAFREPGDRVRFEVPGKYEKLTLFASVCVDGLPNDYNSLLMTENHAIGDLRWQLIRDGRLALGVSPALGLQTGAAVDDQRFETVQTAPVLTDALIGRWITIASVLDSEAGTITHYVNGQAIETGKLKRKAAAQLNTMELGNWGIQVDDPRWTWTKAGGPAFYHRNFVGRIDEFALFSRALSAEEIREQSSVDESVDPVERALSR